MFERIKDRLIGRDYTPFTNDDALGAFANSMLRDPAYLQARENVVMRILSSWVATQPDQVSKREQLWMQIQALGDIHTELVVFVQNAKKEQDNA